MEEYQKVYIDSEAIQLDIIMLCDGLSRSSWLAFYSSSIATGREILKQKHIFQLVPPILNKYPTNTQLCLSLVHIILSMNQDSLKLPFDEY